MPEQTAAAPAPTRRYHTLLIILHWLMALAFLGMLGSGLTMADMEGPSDLKSSLFHFHKSMGVILLLAVFVRMGLRAVFGAPPLPAVFSWLEVLAAKAGHAGLYALMMLMPLTGWLMVSSHPRGAPIDVFGVFTWPLIPGITPGEALNDAAGEIHETLAKILMLLITVHIAALVWHAVKDKEFLLPRMWWAR